MKALKALVALAALTASTTLWAQGSGGSHGASPPIPFPGMDPITTRIIQGGDLNPGRRASDRSDAHLPGPLLVEVDASEPWPKGPRPSQAGLDQVLAAISDVNSKYATGLQLPTRIGLRFFTLSGLEGEWLADTGYGIPPTRFDATKDVITAGEALGSTLGEPQTPAVSLPVTVHEYGHALFWVNLGPRLPLAHDLRNLLRKSGTLGDQLGAMSASVHGGLACQLDPNKLGPLLNDPTLRDDPATQAACRNWSGIQGQLNYVLSEIELNAVHKRINAYAELFSDLVAVIEAKSPTAMVDALSLPGLRDNEGFMTRVRLRSFAVCPSASEATVDSADPEDHGYFAPVRCELGKLVQGGASRLLARAFGVLADDLAVSTRLARPKDPVADNERLIEELREEFL